MCRSHNHKRWAFFKVFFGILFVGVISTVLMLLWNWLMPLLFGFKAIDYLQAVGLLVLSKILFSGVGMRHSHNYSRHEAWNRKFKTDCDKSTSDIPKE